MLTIPYHFVQKMRYGVLGILQLNVCERCRYLTGRVRVEEISALSCIRQNVACR